MADYNRRDALQSKLAWAVIEVNAATEVANAAEARLSQARAIRDTIKAQLDSLDVVQVAYTTTSAGKALVTPLQSRETFDYIDATAKGLHVGDVVIAPTRYNRYQQAIVVSVGEPRTYFGRLNRIAEVLYP